mmetsp:Transcript_3791/g.5642  ORF Transcript_3791/g.5642 Transcript_3791/m.5642 type:complete len:248 (+) Transcript_3791:148-891(+)
MMFSEKRTSCRLKTCVFFLVLGLLFCTSLARVDRNAGHPHRGKLTPYKPGPFDLKLTPSDEKELVSGKSVMKQVRDAGESAGGRAICVQDVNAPKSAVWNQILNFDSYVGKVNKLKECKKYFAQRNKDGSSTIKVKMLIGVLPGYKYEYYCDHTFRPECNSLVWSLDYDKRSDFDDVAGHWHLEDNPNKPGTTRVFYACDIKFFGAVPAPVMNILSKQALKQATSWVKRESEELPTESIPAYMSPAY